MRRSLDVRNNENQIFRPLYKGGKLKLFILLSSARVISMIYFILYIFLYFENPLPLHSTEEAVKRVNTCYMDTHACVNRTDACILCAYDPKPSPRRLVSTVNGLPPPLPALRQAWPAHAVDRFLKILAEPYSSAFQSCLQQCQCKSTGLGSVGQVCAMLPLKDIRPCGGLTG